MDRPMDQAAALRLTPTVLNVAGQLALKVLDLREGGEALHPSQVSKGWVSADLRRCAALAWELAHHVVDQTPENPKM